MSERNKRKTKSDKLRGIILTATTLYGISSLYLIYNILLLTGIETIFRIGFIVFLVILMLLVWRSSIKTIKKGKLKRTILFILLTLIVAAMQFTGARYINKAYTSISKMNKVEATYNTNLIAMSDSKIDTVADLKNKKIGIIKDTNSIEGYIISQEIIDANKIDRDNLVEYSDFVSMLSDLYDEKVDAIFISGGYTSMFSSIDQFADIKSDTKVITSKSKTMTKQDNQNTTNNNTTNAITEPFTILIMGIDSTEEDIKSATSFNGDSLILVTFNPKTLNATMLSIPRDTFVPIMCFSGHRKNKITHAAWYGESCMIDTIKNFTGINIDYYAKINFKGVVKLVDALGGVEVDVPYSFCEQNSNREWGKNTVYVTKGLQTLTGEQALAFARNRHPNPSMCSKKWTNYYSDDFVRGQNQQTVIRAIIDKLKTVRDVNKLYEVLDLIEKSMDTNLSTNQILSFYNIGKSILAHSKTEGELLNFQKLYLSTYGAMIYDEEMKMNLSDQIYYEDSLAEVVDAMQVNLGIKEPEIIKTFSFSVNKTYEEKVIGKGNYSESSIPLVPTFTSGRHTKTTATSWGTKNGVTITFKTVDSSESKYIEGQIIAQSVPASSLVSIAKTKGITLTVVHKITSTNSSNPGNTTSSKVDCTDADNKTNSVCDVPNFVGRDLSAVTAWQAKITSGSITISKSSEKTTNKDEDNEVFEQDGPAIGSSLYGNTKTLIIKYYVYEEPSGDPAIDNSGVTQP